MALIQNLTYVSNGLVLFLDAGNTSSYPGTGTTWTDLSGNGYNFTINASAYTNYTSGATSSGGAATIKYMDFNGSYGCAKRIVSSALADIPLDDTGAGVTILCWGRVKDSNADWRTLIRSIVNDHHIIVGGVPDASGYNVGFYDNDSGAFQDSGFDIRNVPGYPYEFHQMCWQWPGTSPYYKYQIDDNNTVLGSNTNTASRFNRGFCCVGAFHGASTTINTISQPFGDVAVFMAYNRILTATEIAQNFYYFKNRFNRMQPDNTAGLTASSVDITTRLPAPNSSTVGAYLYNDGTNFYWKYPGDTQSTAGSGFQYRTILTHGYLAAGYKGSNPWRSVNRTWHATDVTIYCGEQLDKAGAYIDGTFSDYNAYVHATNDAFQGVSAHTSSYSLTNGTRRSRGESTHSPTTSSGFGFPTATGVASGVGGWNMSVGRQGGHAGCVNQIGQVGYITAGGSAVTDKFHFPSETMFVTTSAPSAGGISACAHGQTKGWYSLSGGKYYVTYSTDTWTSYSNSISPDGWSKILSTKWGYHYGGTGGNTTTGFGKFSDSTGSDISTSLAKLRAVGEENFQMGQNWGYMIGEYDGQQTNMTVRHMYANDAMVTLGAVAQPKGHFGQSSGACSSAAATILQV